MYKMIEIKPKRYTKRQPAYTDAGLATRSCKHPLATRPTDLMAGNYCIYKNHVWKIEKVEKLITETSGKAKHFKRLPVKAKTSKRAKFYNVHCSTGFTFRVDPGLRVISGPQRTLSVPGVKKYY